MGGLGWDTSISAAFWGSPEVPLAFSGHKGLFQVPETVILGQHVSAARTAPLGACDSGD